MPTAFALLPQQKAGLCCRELGPCRDTSTLGTYIQPQNYSRFPKNLICLPKRSHGTTPSTELLGREGGTKLLQDKPGSRCSLLPSERKIQGKKGVFRLIDAPRGTTVLQPQALALECVFFFPPFFASWDLVLIVFLLLG